MADDIPVYGDDSLDERLKSFEKEKKGLINDLQKERAERHALEQRLAQVEQSMSSASESNGEERPEERVNRLAADPDGYISEIVAQAVEPLRKSLISVQSQRRFDTAYNWLAKQEGKDVDEIYGSDIEQEIVRVSKENGLTTLDPVEGTKAAYKILQQERREKEAKETERSRTIDGVATETVRTPVRTGAMRFTREQIRKMTPEEYNRNRDAIKEAADKGLIS